VQARDYRYVSPEFHFDPKSAEILALLGASLVNDPNFPQLALNRGHDPEPSLMNLTAIARALGIADTADEAACITAINSLRQERQTALNAAQHPDPTRFAPRDELTVALNRATTAEAELRRAPARSCRPRATTTSRCAAPKAAWRSSAST
jgi:phage I-like protein